MIEGTHMGKIVTINELDSIIKLEKSKNKRIILACGCFEIFHIGHLEYLEGSKTNGDILIVAVNSDNYIKRTKQKDPVFNCKQRCKIISALSCVDYVFEFDELTPEKYLMSMSPHVFTKGIDRQQILERDLCDRLNIDVVVIGQKKLSSSSDLRKYLIE